LKGYNAFRKNEHSLILPIIALAVSSSEPPYHAKPEGTVGGPPADPKAIVVCLLIRAIFGYSYRSVYSFLASSREYREVCGIAKRLPGCNTIQEHCKDVPERYLDGLIRLTAALILQAQDRTKCDAGSDSTGLFTRKYGRWLEVRNSRRRKKRRFVKFHAHATTDAEMPFFLSAKVTKGYKADSKQFRDLLRKTGGIVEIIEDEALDKEYLSRLNAQLIANIGAHPYVALKENTSSALSHGYPAWNSMVHEAWEHKEEYDKHYHRRSVVEGLFNAFKERFGREAASKIRHNQNVDVFCRVLAWNVLALAYHSYG
jgi:transposase